MTIPVDERRISIDEVFEAHSEGQAAGRGRARYRRRDRAPRTPAPQGSRDHDPGDGSRLTVDAGRRELEAFARAKLPIAHGCLITDLMPYFV
jgi:hypothetical protein